MIALVLSFLGLREGQGPPHADTSESAFVAIETSRQFSVVKGWLEFACWHHPSLRWIFRLPGGRAGGGIRLTHVQPNICRRQHATKLESEGTRTSLLLYLL